MSNNCQDNKCKRSSQSTIMMNLRVAAYEHINVVGERFWRDLSCLNLRQPFSCYVGIPSSDLHVSYCLLGVPIHLGDCGSVTANMRNLNYA